MLVQVDLSAWRERRMSNETRRVLITARFDPEWVARWQARWPALRFELHPTRHAEKIPLEVWREVEILYTFNTLPPPEWAPRLRWVQLHSAGADHVLEHPLFRSPVEFTTASGVHAINIAEYVFAMALAWFHRLPRMLEWQARGQWPPDRERWALFVPEELWGKTIGIVGYGSIGRQVARLAKAFGMRVLAMQRGEDRRDHGFVFPGTGDPEGTLPDRFYTPAQLHEMLAESDIVVIAVPLTPETRGMFNESGLPGDEARRLPGEHRPRIGVRGARADPGAAGGVDRRGGPRCLRAGAAAAGASPLAAAQRADQPARGRLHPPLRRPGRADLRGEPRPLHARRASAQPGR
jgi:phosphoglycerate dehydrogenase-like enzyme